MTDQETVSVASNSFIKLKKFADLTETNSISSKSPIFSRINTKNKTI